jgi:CheY-like chemotaxis protein
MQLNHNASTWLFGFIRPAPRHSAAATLTVPVAAAQATSLKVLLADDCEINSTLACAQLLRLGIEPTLACDGLQALELVRSQHFDLVLMDISMPVMDGLEATKHIRRFEQEHPERKRVPVVAYTAGATADDPNALKRCGFDAVLRKPSNTRMVGACLQEVCGVSVE